MAKNTIPYGYRIVDGKAVVMEDEAERLRVLCRAYLSGQSFCAAAQTAGIDKSHAALRLMMENPLYLGDAFYPPFWRKKPLTPPVPNDSAEKPQSRAHPKSAQTEPRWQPQSSTFKKRRKSMKTRICRRSTSTV